MNRYKPGTTWSPSPVLSATDTRLTALQLNELWGLVEYVTRRDLSEGTPAIAPPLTSFAPGELSRALRRHRLVLPVLPYLNVQELPRVDGEDLVATARRQSLKALQLGRNTATLSALLTDLGVQHLFLKGAPLSLQTTGTLSGRSSVDIDIWIRSSDLSVVIEAFGKAGLRPEPGMMSTAPGTVGFRYGRWSLSEINLVSENVTVDLHWWPSHVRGLLPSFTEAWNRRMSVVIGATSVPTLNSVDAFVHSCVHAQTDGWFWLRGVLDIARLSRKISPSDLREYPRKAVIPSATVAWQITREPSLRTLAVASPTKRERFLNAAQQAQRQSVVRAAEVWDPRVTLMLTLPRLRQSSHPSNVVRVATNSLLPANSFLDPNQNSLSARAAVTRRTRRLGRRVMGKPVETREERRLIRG